MGCGGATLIQESPHWILLEEARSTKCSLSPFPLIPVFWLLALSALQATRKASTKSSPRKVRLFHGSFPHTHSHVQDLRRHSQKTPCLQCCVCHPNSGGVEEQLWRGEMTQPSKENPCSQDLFPPQRVYAGILASSILQESCTVANTSLGQWRRCCCWWRSWETNPGCFLLPNSLPLTWWDIPGRSPGLGCPVPHTWQLFHPFWRTFQLLLSGRFHCHQHQHQKIHKEHVGGAELMVGLDDLEDFFQS